MQKKVAAHELLMSKPHTDHSEGESASGDISTIVFTIFQQLDVEINR